MTGVPRHIRLIGPARRRLVMLDRMSTSHAATMLQLGKLGWTLYTGPATTDRAGWITPGSDPDLAASPEPYDDWAGVIRGGVIAP